MAVFAAWKIITFVAAGVGWDDVLNVLKLGLFTLTRVVVLIALASLVWVPIGVAVGLRPRLAEKIQPLAQFLAAFPNNDLKSIHWYPAIPPGLEEMEGRVLDRVKAAN